MTTSNDYCTRIQLLYVIGYLLKHAIFKITLHKLMCSEIDK